MILTFPTIRKRHGHLVKPPARFLLLLIGWAVVTGPYVTLRGKADDLGYAHRSFVLHIDRLMGFGETPGQRLQDWLYRGWGPVEWFAFVGHASFFVLPWVLCAYVAIFCPQHMWSLLLAVACVCYLAVVSFIFLPVEPPWMATDITRILTHYGEVKALAGHDGNQVAAFPSLHVGGPALYGFWLLRRNHRVGWLFLGFATWIGFAVVYFGEHYTTDVLAGFLLAYLVVVLTAPIARTDT